MSAVLNGSRTSAGNAWKPKPNFDDVTINHECELPASPNVILSRFTSGFGQVIRLLAAITVSKRSPSTKKYFPSSHAVHKEIIRHMFSNYWYIIHPCSMLKFYWNSFMAFVFYLMFFHTPFLYSFNQDTASEVWCYVVGTVLNSFCIFDLFANFFAGYKTKYGNFIVLHHASIIKNYLRGSFWLDFLSTLPVDIIYRSYFFIHACQKTALPISITAFHLSFLMKFLRFHSMTRMIKSLKFLMKFLKFSHIKAMIIILVLKTILFCHICVCIFKAVVTGVFFYFYPDNGPKIVAIAELMDPEVPYWLKYLKLVEFMNWAVFDTSFGSEVDSYIPGKIITSACIILATAYNVFIIVQILNILNILHAPRTKYYETMNQLDAYMQKKQFPIQLQNRLKFFYRKKFRKFYYQEDEILEILSEPLQREIIINSGQLFVERVELFKDLSESLIGKIARSCKKEEFLPNDLIIKAGSIGDCMFFIASGTVCATTTNGRELCHYGDGDYFGIAPLAMKNNKHILTFMAIEFCEIYVLDYDNFNKYLQNNAPIMKKVVEVANYRMKLMLDAQEEHKKQLQNKIARESYSD